MVFRFANGIFEPIWNRRYIDHVQITVAETVGVEQRGGYYDQAGALRDMVQNHLFQLLALVAMEPPSSFDAEAVRDEKAKVLRAIQPLSPEEVLTRTVRGQYGPGRIAGEPLAGYREEPRRRAALEHRDLRRAEARDRQLALGGVPFYLRTGKRLAARAHRDRHHFRRPPLALFRGTDVATSRPTSS